MKPWPPEMEDIKKEYGFDEFEKVFTKFCKCRNFKYEEIQYLYTMINVFYTLNKVDNGKK